MPVEWFGIIGGIIACLFVLLFQQLGKFRESIIRGYINQGFFELSDYDMDNNPTHLEKVSDLIVKSHALMRKISPSPILIEDVQKLEINLQAEMQFVEELAS